LAIYYLNEGSFELGDDGVVDVTVHTLDVEAFGTNLRLMVERAPFPGGSLAAFSERGVALLGERLRGYALLGTRESEGATEFCARYLGDDGGASYLRYAHVATSGGVLSFSVTAPIAKRDAGDAFMDEVLASLRFRDGD